MERRQRRRFTPFLLSVSWVLLLTLTPLLAVTPMIPSPPDSPAHSSLDPRRFYPTMLSQPKFDTITKGRSHGRNVMNVIEEEGLLEDNRFSKSLPRRCCFLAFVIGFFILFSLFAHIFWSASRPQKTQNHHKDHKI